MYSYLENREDCRQNTNEGKENIVARRFWPVLEERYKPENVVGESPQSKYDGSVTEKGAAVAVLIGVNSGGFN